MNIKLTNTTQENAKCKLCALFVLFVHFITSSTDAYYKASINSRRACNLVAIPVTIPRTSFHQCRWPPMLSDRARLGPIASGANDGVCRRLISVKGHILDRRQRHSFNLGVSIQGLALVLAIRWLLTLPHGMRNVNFKGLAHKLKLAQQDGHHPPVPVQHGHLISERKDLALHLEVVKGHPGTGLEGAC